MIYEFSEELREIAIGTIREDRLTAGYVDVEALKASYQFLGVSEKDLNECVLDSVNFRSSIEVYENYSFGILNILNVNDIYGPRDKVGFLIRKNLFLVIGIQDEDNSTREMFEYAVQRFKPETATLEKIIYGFFERLIYEDNSGLDKKELVIEELEEDIHKGDINREFIGDIMALKKEVTHFRNYYEQLIDISEVLAEDENGIFSRKETSYLQILTGKLERLSSHCLMLKENLVQVREAYSASLDYSINSVMKLFTVVTTIFQPLTLIAGWYGMNFTNMPELTWRYGYAAVIVLSLTVVFFCLWLFRKKRLL